jgi:hypothetical protein
MILGLDGLAVVPRAAIVRAGMLAAFGAVAASPAPAAARSPLPFSCPVVTETAAKPERVLAAARQLVPHEYARLRSMGRPAWQHFQIQALVQLSRRIYGPQPPLRRLAVRLCGARVADRTWALSLQFPECQIPCSEDVALVAPTLRGWRIWYSAFRRP